jgi:hypothetical protein
MLKELGRGVRLFSYCEKVFANLYAGSFRQFITGRIGWSCI